MKLYLFILFSLSVVCGLSQNYKAWKCYEYKEGDTILVPQEIHDWFPNDHGSEYPSKAYQYLADYLKFHPEIKKIMILSHSSYRGSEEVNLWITQQRADIIKHHLDQLLENRITIKAKGMGEHYPALYIDPEGNIHRLTQAFIGKPAYKNAEKEKLHRLNKRIEFVVLEADSSQLYKRMLDDIRFSDPNYARIFKLPEIRYEFGRWELQQNDSVNSVDSLKILADFMKEYPGIVVEIMVHTDCRGSDRMSWRPSQRRAQSVVDCLIEHYGISKYRLKAKGYGETSPRELILENGNLLVFTCNYIRALPTKDEQERMHQMNRRTEFQILSFEFKPSE